MKKDLYIAVLLVTFISSCSQSQSSPIVQIPTITKIAISVPTEIMMPTSQPVIATNGFPTLSADQANQEIAELFETNNNCKLPCFWGITPGQTNEMDAKSTLDAFSSVDYGSHSNESSPIEYFFDVNGQNNVGVHITLYLDKDIVGFIQVGDFESPAYHLSEFLVRNGKPDQIMLRTWKSSPSGTDQVPFLIYMYYETSGMLVAYGMGTGTIESDSINGCVNHSPSIQIWGVEKPHNIEEAMKMMGWYDSNLLSISDATTGMLDVDNFYEEFAQSNVETCFSTPRNLWSEADR